MPDKPPECPFIEYLERLRDQEARAVLAALRRGLGKPPGTVPEMYPYVVPFVQGLSRNQEEARYLVASLFAWHQLSWKGENTGNLGASCARLARAVPDSDSVERRFVALLNCRSDDLPVQLRQIIGLLKTREIPILWSKLLTDIQYWNHENRRVQRRWANAFWGHRPR